MALILLKHSLEIYQLVMADTYRTVIATKRRNW